MKERLRHSILLLPSLLILTMVAATGMVAAWNPATVRASHVAPTPVAGNPTCSQLVPGTTELKVEPVADGTYTDGTLTVTIDVTGQTFNFTSNIGIDAVFVKGGPGGNLYLYNPAVTSDTNLSAPDGAGLSHLSFCYGLPTPTPTVTNTPVPPTHTPTATPTNTPVPPTATPTATPTNTPVPPTHTPTATPTNTPVPPTHTPTNTPTNTPVPPTRTPTNTPTNTPVPPTATPTNTPTNTPVPPTRTPTNTPTHTPVPPTATPTKTPTPTPVAFEGCTPGYWKQSQHFDSWTDPYDPTDLVKEVFNVSAFLTGGILDLNGDGKDDTLLDALNYQGGSGTTGAARILLRAAVAALLNAAHPDVDYPQTTTQIINAVNAALASGNRNTILALASKLDKDNNLGCPINGTESLLSQEGLVIRESEDTIHHFQFIPSVIR